MTESLSFGDGRLSVSTSFTRPQPTPNTLDHSPYSFSRSLQPPPSPLPLHPPPSPSHHPHSATHTPSAAAAANSASSPTHACAAFIARLHALRITTVVFDMDHTLTAAHSQGAIPATSLADYLASLSPASAALLPLLLSSGFHVAIATFSDDLYTHSPSLFPFFFNPPAASPTAAPTYYSGRPLVSALLSTFLKPEQLASVLTVALHPDLYTAATPTTSRVVVALPGRVRDMMRRRAAGGWASADGDESRNEGGLSDRSVRAEREEAAEDSGQRADREEDEPSASKTLVPMHSPDGGLRRLPNFSPPPVPMAMSTAERGTAQPRDGREARDGRSWSLCCCFASDDGGGASDGRDARSSSVYNTPAHLPNPASRPPLLTYQPPPLRIAPRQLPSTSPSPTSPMPSPSPPPGSALFTPSASKQLRVTVREDDVVIEDRRYAKDEASGSEKDSQEESKEKPHDGAQSSPVLRSVSSRHVVHMLPHIRSLPTLYDHPESGVFITRALSGHSSATGAASAGSNPFAEETEEPNPFEQDEPREKAVAVAPPPPPPPPPQPRPPPPRIQTTPSPPMSNPFHPTNNPSPRSSSSSASLQSPPSLPAVRPALPSLRVSTSHPSTPSGSSTSHQQSSPHTSSLQHAVPPTSAPSSQSAHFFPRTPKGANKTKSVMPPIPPTPPTASSPLQVAFVPAPPPPPPPPPHSAHTLSPLPLQSLHSELYVNVSVVPASPPPLSLRLGGGLALPSGSPSFRPSVSASASSLMLPSSVQPLQLGAAPALLTLTSASINLGSSNSKHAFYLAKVAALLPPPAAAHPLYPLLAAYPPPPYKTAHMQLVRAAVMSRQRDRVEHSARCKSKRSRDEADGGKVCKCMVDSVPWSSMLLVDDVAENADSALQLGCHAVLVRGKRGLHFDDLAHILAPQKAMVPW